MDRSNYPPKVEVRSADLGGTERTKAFHILKRFLDTGQPGIISGLTVQQSSVGLDRFDLLLGYGYAPNGELTELTATLEGQSAGALPGVPALAGLMYREVTQRAGAAETGGIALDRETVRSSEIRVFTADQWSALPTTFDDDLSADAQDRFLVCGIVTKPTVDGDPLEIVLPPSWDLIKTIGRTAITGVCITAIDPDTADTDPFPQTGTEDQAVLIYQPISTSLAYKAPHDTVNLGWLPPFNNAGVGVAVDVSAGGAFTLTSANGLNTLDVVVDAALLPSTTTSFVVDPLNVSTLYYPAAARGSGRDDIHRHQLGTLVPTAANPHGLRWSDLQTLLEEVFGTLSIGTQYTTLIAGEVPRLRAPANPSIDHATQFRVSELFESEGANTSRFNNLPLGVRVYRNSREGLMFCYNFRIRNSGANGMFERLTANGDDPDSDAIAIEINRSTTSLLVQPAASPDTWTDTTWAAPNIGAVFNHATGSVTVSGDVNVGDDSNVAGDLSVSGMAYLFKQLTLGASLLTGAVDTQLPRLQRQYQDDGSVTRTLLELSEGVTVPGVGRLRIYRATFSGLDFLNPAGGVATAWDFVFNATWDETANQWTQDDATDSSWKLAVGGGGIRIGYVNAGAAAWGDNSWLGGLSLDGFGISLRNLMNYRWAPPRPFIKSIPGIAGLSVQMGIAVTLNVSVSNPEGTLTYIQKTGGAGSAAILWPVELPNGAIVTGARVNSATVVPASFIRAALCRQHVTSGANAESLKAGGTPYDNIALSFTETPLTIDEAALIRTIDNGSYTYFVWLGADNADAVQITGIEIDYTLTEVTLP